MKDVFARADTSYKKYYLEKLLLNEIGHSVDYLYQRYWSKANSKKTEHFANNYAIIWGNNVKQTIEGNNESITNTK